MTFRMTLSARSDFAEITHYTINKWGIISAQNTYLRIKEKTQ